MKVYIDKTIIELDDDEELILIKYIPKENNFKVMLRGVDITHKVKAIVSNEITDEDTKDHLDEVGIDTTEELQGENPIANELDEVE